MSNESDGIGEPDWGSMGFDMGYAGHHDVGDSELKAFRESQRRGQWGNSLPLVQAQAQPLIWVELPPWMARTWTVTLLAMRYQSGQVSTFGGFTPDQQAVPTNFGAGGGAPVRVQMEYGAANAAEQQVIIDYPWTGLTFEVTCATIKVLVAPYGTTGMTVFPSVGAFIVPMGRGGGQFKAPPTFTQFVNVGISATTKVPIPARARAYSIAAADTGTIGNGVTLTQRTTPATLETIVRFDTLAGDSLTPPAYVNYAGALVGNFPLHPLATELVIGNTSATGQSNFQVRFELDLG